MIRSLCASACAVLLLLQGCATQPGPVASDVTSYSNWPASRTPGTYAFERLPSQASSAAQSELEQSARGAINATGFREVDLPSAQFSIQVAADMVPQSVGYPADRVGVFGAFGGGGRGGFSGGGLGVSFGGGGAPTAVGRAVSIVIRERPSNQSLYESRAQSTNGGPDDQRAYAAMFAAALKDFPAAAVNPRRIVVDEP
jgi:hypothetical protein